MIEGREHEIRTVASDRADDVARLARHGVVAFHECEIAVGRGTQQRLEVRASVIGNAHCVSPLLCRALSAPASSSGDEK
jgi:hypothetical protein